MLEKIFDLENFNIISDEYNYYFFRALNMGDNDDIDNNIITDEFGNFLRIRTDRERYERTPKYSETSNLSLEQIFDHIKMHHRKDTNCISLTSNANVAAMYGRGYYKDRYVLVKVPKSELGNSVVNAGLYMMQEIQKRIDNLNDELSDMTKYFISAIDNCKTEEALNEILNRIKTISNENNFDDNMFEEGITFNYNSTTSVDYAALNKRQNLEKNKIIAKLDIIGKNIISNVSNKFLIQTLGNAFSSLELTHYNSINGENVIETPKEIIDIFSLLQQLPMDYPNIDELKQEILNHLNTNKNTLELFQYSNSHLDTENDYTIEKMYNLTNGNVDFYSAIELYKKSFYFSKSKLRTISTVNLLKEITNNNPIYSDIFNSLLNDTYGVEPEIFSRITANKLQVSESVNIDFLPKEKELFDLINNLSNEDLNSIITNPLGALNYYLNNFKSIEHNLIDKETYYANAIIDLFNWEKLNVAKFSLKQRNDIVRKLKENNVVMVYDALKAKGVKEHDIANVLLTTIIKENSLDLIDLKETFSLEELEDFLGYYQVKKTNGLKLRSYQASALKNINESFKNHQFTTAILPTGAGKSFVALAEMLKYQDKEILYLAPNDGILTQIENYIVEYIHGNTLRKTNREIIKEAFPNLKLQTYSSTLSFNQQEIIEHKYDLIIFDELHRSGAHEWKKHVLELLGNQDSNTKVLGITATPQRDADFINMADDWARYFGYTEEEISRHDHLAINMDLEEAIRLGYVVNPKIVNCEYTLKDSNGLLENLLERINTVEDEDKKLTLIKKFDELRRKVNQADGISKIIGDNVKKGGKYIVFCPVVNKDGRVIEDEDGSQYDSKITGEEVIKKYQAELTNYLKEYFNVSDEEIASMIEFNSMLGGYKAKNRRELEKFEQDNPDKIKFMVVMNKLNEGNHVKNISGLIWFRSLDENSKILFLQQFGRIISAKNPNKKMPDEQRPVAIDLVNNTLRVNLNKEKHSTNDLDKLKLIIDWSKSNNYKVPDINSSDKIERSYGSSLKRIQEKYIKYIDNYELINNLKNNEKEQIIQIINLGRLIDLWNFDFPEQIKVNIKNEKSNEDDLGLFELTGILRDYCDLKDEIDELYPILTVEEKLKEIYEISEGKYENVPKYDSEIRFRDGSSKIGMWIIINRNKAKILELVEINKYARFVAEAKGWLNLTFEEKLKEIYEISEGKQEKVPKHDSEIRFSDESSIIGTWTQTHKEKILELAETNEYAKFVAEAKGWFNLTFEEKLKEIYEISEGKIEKVSKQGSEIRFSDESSIIGTWTKNHKEKILELAETNEYAKFVVEAKGWFNLTFEEKLKEIYEISEGKIEKVSKQGSEIRFSDGSSKIGTWINYKKEKILELAEINDYARFVAEAKGWFNLTFEERLKEIYEISEGKKENIPKYDSEIKFSDGSTKIVTWLYRDETKEKILELAETNEYAKFVAEAKGWFDLTFEEKLKEIYEISEGKYENVPKYDSEIRFSDGSTKICRWLAKGKTKEKILELAETNEYAKFVAEAKGWFNITFEERLKEIYEISEGKKENIPKYDSEIKFSDGSTKIWMWLAKGKTKEKTLELTETNLYARFIAEAKGWITFEKAKSEFEETSKFEEVKSSISQKENIKDGRKIH